MANCGSLALISRTDNQFVNFFKKPGIILTGSLVMQYIETKIFPSSLVIPCNLIGTLKQGLQLHKEVQEMSDYPPSGAPNSLGPPHLGKPQNHSPPASDSLASQ